MAIMIPEYAVCNNETVSDIYHKLSTLLGSGYKVVQYLHSLNDSQNTLLRSHDKTQQTQKPHFDGSLLDGSLFWVQKSQQSLFIYISHATQANEINKAQQKQLAKALRNDPEIKAIRAFQQKLIPEPLHSHSAKLAPFLVLFPHSDDENIKFNIQSHGLFLAGKQSLDPNNLLTLLRTSIGIETTPFVIKHIRATFSPEVLISNAEQNQFLDEDQEIALKSEIQLPIEARRPDNYNLRVLNGVAGSGKTQVLIHRARLIHQLFPMQRVLILCHNQAIKQAIENQYKVINPHDRKIKISSFLDWCRKNIKLDQKLIYTNEIDETLQNALKRHLANSDLSTNDLLEELNTVNHHLIYSESDYLAYHTEKSRKSHHAELDKALQQDIWRALLYIKNTLKQKRQLLWEELPKLLLQATEEGKLLEHYDHILVDEAQYFSPIHYELIKQSLKQQSGQLYLAYDENQGFLPSRIHLQDTGLDLRDHSMRLLLSYRLNPHIMRAAHAVHLKQLPNHSDDIFSNSGHAKNTAEKPQLLHFTDEKSEQTRLLKEIHDLLDPSDTNSQKYGLKTIKAKDILILSCHTADAHPLASTIRQTLKLTVDLPTLTHNTPDALRVCPLESATGLESPIVFITGIQHLFDSGEHSKNNTEPTSKQINNARKLYMGMTRASRQLILMLTSDTIPEALINSTISQPSQTEKNAEVHYLNDVKKQAT